MNEKNSWNQIATIISAVASVLSILFIIATFVWKIPNDIHESKDKIRNYVDGEVDQLERKIDRLDDKIEGVRGELSEISKVVYRIEGLLDGRQDAKDSGG